MKLTCLSEGGGFYSPPCHILQWCGFTLLFECPVDLSALAVFSPIPTTGSSSSDNNSLIRAVPWYKTVASLHLWDPSSIDVVLISSPWALLGLPFLTRKPGFSSSTKIYATEATVRFGHLMMKELTFMHMEYVRYYGPDKKLGLPDWMNWTNLERLQMELKSIVLGEKQEELSGWVPIYSAGDIKDCIDKIQPLKLGEEVCFNGTLVIRALSSGLDIGSCNWSIKSPKGSLVYLSSSVFGSAHAMEFDYPLLSGHDIIIFSDFSSLDSMDYDEEDTNKCALSGESEDCSMDELSGNDELEAENEKMHFICSCIVDSVKKGGSALIPSGRFGVVLPLLEHICNLFDSLNMKVPIFIISETAQETLALTNSIPEWLCKQRQKKLFSGEALFQHMELIKEGIISVHPFLCSSDLLEIWKEPCIVISPHWSLRLGSAVQLLHRWHADPRSLLILEEGVHDELALMPFKPLKMKVLQCSFLSGIQMKKVNPLFQTLRSKIVLVPQSLRSQFTRRESELYKIYYYTKNEIARIPSLKEGFEAYLATDLVFQLQPTKLPEKNIAVARLKGKLLLRKGIYYLTLPNKQLNMSVKPSVHWGTVEPTCLLRALNEKEIDGSILHNENYDFCVCVKKPAEALIEVKGNKIMISCEDKTVSALINEALNSVCNRI
ncbi:Integrator complex subunit 9 [Rhynchospora pubera]|uniref:Integrator complex subunit 9 n=1 Tax=Rhynchospora pubera TaxID=906938 RepID=A0AAV8H344_9POAL|nr:Integrator complex subunit 9 [Rhynchospora pubera]